MRFFYVDPSRISASRAVLEGAEASHLKNVLRLKRGETVCLAETVPWGSAHPYSRGPRLLEG
jgi:16S rRNA U1498 N3-methylase RsmE